MIQYTIANNLTAKKILEEIFIFDRTSGLIHTFNGMGAYLWEKIAAATPFEEMVDTITEEFEVSKETASSDLFDFIQQLEVQHLLTMEG